MIQTKGGNGTNFYNIYRTKGSQASKFNDIGIINTDTYNWSSNFDTQTMEKMGEKSVYVCRFIVQ